MALIERVYDDFFGGANLRDAPLIGDTDLISSENMEPIPGGGLIGRGGQTEYNATQIDANAIRSLFRFYRQNGTGIKIATSGTKIYKGNDGPGTFTDITGALVLTADKKFSIVAWSAKDKVYMTNGVEAIQNWDGVAASVSALGGSPPIVSMLELHQDRLYGLQDNLVRYTDLNVDNVWPAANGLNIADSTGNLGKFIKSYNRLLIIGKGTGLYRFEGSPKLGGQLRRYSDIGCIAPWTADVTPYGVPFLAGDGLYITDGFTVTPISGKIDPLFTSFFRGAVGKYYPNKNSYLLSFSTSGGANDQLWEGYLLDSPNGPVISWHKRTGFKVESFTIWGGGSDTGQIYYGRSDGGKVRRMDTGKQDVGVDYQSSFQTRWDDFGLPKRDKQTRWIMPVFEGVKTVTVQSLYSFGKFVGSSKTADAESQTAISWGPGTVTWGPGSVSWLGSVAISNRRTSILDFKAGRYLSFKFFNTGDGPDFKFHKLVVEARVKDSRHIYEPFSLAQSA